MATQAEPCFALTYGRSGIGKTTDCGYSFPNALFLAAPGALKCVRSVCGYEPGTMEVNTIMEATQALKQYGGGEFDAIIVDDFSFLAEQTMVHLEKRHTGFRLFGALREAVLSFRAAARYSKLHVVLTCWEKGPKLLDNGTTIRGGPDLTGKLPEQLPAMCDLVLRADRDPMSKPWHGVYRVDSGPQWIGKDRDHGCPPVAPMNLGEILRGNGYAVKRHRGMPWQEETVAALHQKMLAGNPKAEAEAAYATLCGKVDPRAARWTVRDAWDRTTLAKAKLETQKTFF